MSNIEVELIKLNHLSEEMYPIYVLKAIRKRYSLSQELAILRQRDVKPKEFEEYNIFVEECKASAKAELGIGGTVNE